MSEHAFHPLANEFPLMEGGEFAALVKDIGEHKLREPIVLYEGMILDGRNRARACCEVGVEPQYREMIFDSAAEAAAYVISANIHRRHLTAQQRRELIEKLLKANPTKSDRQIADMMHVSHSTVGKSRKHLEKIGDVANVATSTDTKGRSQPRRRSKAPKEPPASGAEAVPTEPQVINEPATQPATDDPAISAQARKDGYAAQERSEASVDNTSPAAPTEVEEPQSSTKASTELPFEPQMAATPETTTKPEPSVSSRGVRENKRSQAEQIRDAQRGYAATQQMRIDELNTEKRTLENKLIAQESEIKRLQDECANLKAELKLAKDKGVDPAKEPQLAFDQAADTFLMLARLAGTGRQNQAQPESFMALAPASPQVLIEVINYLAAVIDIRGFKVSIQQPPQPKTDDFVGLKDLFAPHEPATTASGDSGAGSAPESPPREVMEDIPPFLDRRHELRR